MRVEATITKSDLLKLHFYMLLRLKANQALFVFLFVCAGIGGSDMVGMEGIVPWLLFTLLGSAIAFLVLFFIGSGLQTIMATSEKGFIGDQVFEILDDGFLEKTMGTETKTAWAAIEKIYKTEKYIFVKINGSRFHIVPKRAFSDQTEFCKFWDLISGNLSAL